MATNKEKFDWNKFKRSSKICVRCETQEEADMFCELMDSNGMTWCNGKRYTEKYNRWDEYKERTCYYGDGRYCRIDWSNKYGHTILKFSLLDFD